MTEPVDLERLASIAGNLEAECPVESGAGKPYSPDCCRFHRAANAIDLAAEEIARLRDDRDKLIGAWKVADELANATAMLLDLRARWVQAPTAAMGDLVGKAQGRYDAARLQYAKVRAVHEGIVESTYYEVARLTHERGEDD